MGIKDAGQRWEKVALKLEREQGEQALQVGFDLLGLVKARVQRDGINAEGQQFSSYSPAYAKRGRAELGYQRQYKDFTRTGELLETANAQLESQSGNQAEVSIGPTGQKNVNKAAGAAGQGDLIFRTSQQERDLAMQSYGLRVNKIMQE